MIRSSHELSAAERVYSAGRRDLIDYRDRVMASTPTRHGAAIEAALLVACQKRHDLNDAYVTYLRKGGTPGRQNQSRRWGEADHAYAAALETLAAAMGTLYPKPDGSPPVPEVAALIDHRVGLLCSGWYHDGTLTHAPDDICHQHPASTV